MKKMALNNSSNIKTGTILTYITQFLNIGISFIYVPIMLGILGQEEYGLYALVQSLVSYLQMSEMGIGITATRYNAKYIAQNDINGQRSINGMFLLLYLGIATICFIAGMVVYHYIPEIYKHYSESSISLIGNLFLLALANLIITLIFKLFNAVIIAYEKFIFIKSLSLIQTIINPACLLAVLYMGQGSIGMLIVTTVLSLLSGLIQMIYCFSKLRLRLSFHNFERGLFGTIMGFTAFVFLNSCGHQLFANSDKVIISIILSETAIAIYAIVLQFHSYFFTFANVISGFYLPRFTKMVKETRQVTQPLMEEIIRTARIQVLIAGLIFGGFAAIGRPFIIRWVGAEYEPAYLLSVIVLFAEYVGSAQSMFNSLMQAMNLHKVRSLIGLACALIKVVVTVFAIKWWGLTGCAFAYIAMFLMRLYVYNIYYKVRVGINVKAFWLTLGRLFAPLSVLLIVLYVISYFALKIFDASTYVEIALYALVYIAIYGFVCWKYLMNDYEKNLILSVVKRK